MSVGQAERDGVDQLGRAAGDGQRRLGDAAAGAIANIPSGLRGPPLRHDRIADNPG